MKRYLNILMIALLLVLIILTLRKNKQVINAEIDYATQKVAALPVRVEKVKLSILNRTLRLPTVLEAREDLIVMSQTQGQVVKVYKSIGDVAEKGEVIMKVDDSVLGSQAQLAEANYEKSRKDVERATKLKEAGAMTAQQFEGLELKEKQARATYVATKKQLDNTSVKAPISGTINQLFTKEGSVIGPGVPLCELVDTRRLKMQVNVDEDAIQLVTKGQTVEITTDIEPEKAYAGMVETVSVKSNPGLQYPVTVEMENTAGSHLKAGMTATVIFSFADSIESPVIPRQAIVGSLKDASVFVVENGKAIKKPVAIGYSDTEKVMVLSGLSGGETLVVSGQSTLQDGQQIKILK